MIDRKERENLQTVDLHPAWKETPDPGSMQGMNLGRKERIHTFDYTHSLGHTFSESITWVGFTTKYYTLGGLTIINVFSYSSAG